jgi:hypothetical protein
MNDNERRNFLLSSRDMVVGALTAGTLVACASAGPATVEAQTSSSPSTAAFGWEIDNLSNNGADVYFSVQRDLVLNTVDVDLAFSPVSPPAIPGLAEVLCQVAVSRAGPPSFGSGSQAYYSNPVSPAFAAVQTYNPNGLTMGFSPPIQDTFVSVILKSWVPVDGTASQAYRHVQILPSVSLKTGDYLLFHMDHYGPAVDAEMQVILAFQ